jgi:hypothetical protein
MVVGAAAAIKIDQELRKNCLFVRRAFRNRRNSENLASISTGLCFALMNRAGKEAPMTSDIISYAPLVVVFVVTGLRMFVDKPNQAKSISMRPWREAFRRTNRRQRS